MKAFIFGVLIFASSCAYRWGAAERTIPGGTRLVRVPIFQNNTSEVGIETSFTNALIDELIESHVAEIQSAAPVEIKGTIEKVDYVRSGQKTLGVFGEDKWGIATDYRVIIVVSLAVSEKTGGRTLWSGQFTGERTFTAAQIQAPVVNSANPLYNLSARRRNIAELAKDMMGEASDRMTENF